jgi:hypothetical protein
VLITAAAAGGPVPATISVVGGASTLSLTAGDQILVTHGSVILDVLAGTVEATFIADTGNVATASLDSGNGLTFKPDTFTFIAPATNTEAVQTTFMADSGQKSTVSLVSGDSVLFQPETATFVAPPTNTQPLEITVDGTVVTIDPGETVTAENSTPIITLIGSQECTETQLTAQVVASDRDVGDSLAYAVSFVSKSGPGALNNPLGFSIDSSGLFHWTPGGGQLGQYTFKVTVSDGDKSTEQTFVVTTLSVVDGVLTIVGTSGADKIDIKPTNTPTTRQARMFPINSTVFSESENTTLCSLGYIGGDHSV